MAPQPGVTFPNRKFIVTSLNEATGVETNVISSTALPNNYTSDQTFRRQIYDNARTYIAANPGVYIVYGPTTAAATGRMPTGSGTRASVQFPY